MIEIPVITEKRRVASSRLETRALFAGPADGKSVVFLHGNLSAATWFEETMTRLPSGFRGIAPDLRGYGEADPAKKIDATRGMGDLSDDLAAFLDALSIECAVLVGHSLGGSVLWRFIADHPARAVSVVQVCPGSPYGFGGCRPDGTPCFADGAGSGVATVNPGFVKLLMSGERGDAPCSPRNILNNFVWKPPFVPARMEDILTSALAQHLGEMDYPGDAVRSENWPMAAAGKHGPINALSPIYQGDALAFCKANPKPPILWIRGADDAIVSDNSMFDLGALAKMGMLDAVPGWPGEEVFPPQPMVSQTRAALEEYRKAGGVFSEVVLENCGHSPYLEKPGEFDRALRQFLSA